MLSASKHGSVHNLLILKTVYKAIRHAVQLFFSLNAPHSFSVWKPFGNPNTCSSETTGKISLVKRRPD